jgi:hypothetical protein
MQSARSISSGKRLVIPSLILLLLCAVGAAGQTEDQLGARLKKVTAFEIRPGIDVFPSFAADGSVCRMVIEKRQYINPRNADFDITIPSAVANQVVDELVPPTERGKPSKYLSNESFVAGGASFIKQDYENVSVGMYGSSVEGKANGASVIVITWPKRTCSSSR